MARKRKSKIRYKACPACANGVCKTCKGSGQVRIVKGRSKGATFEREIARQVTAWTGTEFKRTPMSGGWAKTGDITPKDPKAMVDWPFNMELKNQESWTIPMLFKVSDTVEAKKMQGWWKQCTDDATKAKKIPLLLMTKKNEPVFLMMRTTEFKRLRLHKNVPVSMKCGFRRIVLWEDFIKIPYKTILKGLRG